RHVNTEATDTQTATVIPSAMPAPAPTATAGSAPGSLADAAPVPVQVIERTALGDADATRAARPTDPRADIVAELDLGGRRHRWCGRPAATVRSQRPHHSLEESKEESNCCRDWCGEPAQTRVGCEYRRAPPRPAQASALADERLRDLTVEGRRSED